MDAENPTAAKVMPVLVYPGISCPPAVIDENKLGSIIKEPTTGPLGTVKARKENAEEAELSVAVRPIW